jgi:hypothetical protein
MVTVITKTVGPVGRDYATPALAEANVSTIAGGTDLVALDVAIVFEIDAAIYDGFWQVSTSGLNADATRNVTYRAAPGVIRGAPRRGAHITRTPSGLVMQPVDKFTRIEGLTFRALTSNCCDINDTGSHGIVFSECVLEADQAPCATLNQGGSASAYAEFRNCLCISPASRAFDARGTRAEAYWRMTNCTCFVGSHAWIIGTSSSTDIFLDITNNLVLGLRSYFVQGSYTGTLTVTGTNNVGGPTNPFPTDQLAGGQTWDVTTDLTLASDGNNALYDKRTYKLSSAANNDALLVGIGPDADSDVPTSDILGAQRTGSTTQVGAFQSLHHIWSNYAMARNTVKIEGAISCGPGQISACFDVLGATGAATDETAAIPQGTQALWMQQLLPAGANSEEITVQVLLDGSTAVNLMTMGGSSVDAGSAMGFIKLPFDVATNDGTYPRIRAYGATSAWSLRVIAVGAAGPTWS